MEASGEDGGTSAAASIAAAVAFAPASEESTLNKEMSSADIVAFSDISANSGGHELDTYFLKSFKTFAEH
eukprot:11926935-Alexandrium_andersonii.AAC.1